MTLRPSDPTGFQMAGEGGLTVLGKVLTLAPWETVTLPDPLGRFILQQSQGGLEEGDARLDLPHPWRVRVVMSCP